MNQKKRRLAERLVEMGACPHEKEAAARIMAGEVYINGQIARNGAMVKESDAVTLKGVLPYASKGGFKLSGALEDFGVQVEGRVYPAVVNVGRHPTLPEGSVTVEAYALDACLMLYGKKVRLSFLHFQRPERLFDGVEALKAQITRDAQDARDYFASLR